MFVEIGIAECEFRIADFERQARKIEACISKRQLHIRHYSLTRSAIRSSQSEIRSHFRFSLAVLPVAVKIARSSPDSCSRRRRSSGSPIFDSSKSSSQYLVSAASFSTMAILWMKSLRDSARLASRWLAPIEVPDFSS